MDDKQVKIIMSLNFSKQHILALERHDQQLLTGLKKRYWQTNEGRRDWFWWRMGQDETNEDLDDFVLSEAALPYRKYQYSRSRWHNKINEILFRLSSWGNFDDSVFYTLADREELDMMMEVVGKEFREWDKAFKLRLKNIDWSPPCHPFNTPDIDKKMSEFEDSLSSKGSSTSSSSPRSMLDFIDVEKLPP